MADELFFWQCTGDKQSNYILAPAIAVPDLVQKNFGIVVTSSALPLYDAGAMAAASWLGFQPEVRLALRRAQLGANDPQYQQFVAQAQAEVDPVKASAIRTQVMLRGSYLIAVADGIPQDVASNVSLLAQAANAAVGA